MDALEPSPISLQLPRSCSEACISRGYHTSGTEMVLPSDSSAVNVSSVTVISFTPP